jgi:hypothetical protein
MAFTLARRSREHRQRVFKSGFFCAAFLSVALTASPNHTSPPARGFPLKTTPTGEGWRLRFFVKGDRPNTHSRAEKKKTMKTTSQKNNSRLMSRSAQLNSTNTSTPEAQSAVAPAAQPEKKDNRLPIDTEARKKNRTLPTTKVLELLKTSNPGLFNLAEVVGKWVWVAFRETPAPELRQILAQLGFHWNRERQAWQHPCGAFRLRGYQDPHEKYASYFPADSKTA